MTCYGVFAAATAIIVIIAICILLYITNNSRYMSPNTMGVVESLYEGPYRPNMKPATGPFESNCRNCRGSTQQGNAYIICECKRDNGTWNTTRLDKLRRCRKFINGSPQLKNIDGVLKCA